MSVSQEEEDYLAALRARNGLPPDPNAGNNANPVPQPGDATYGNSISSDPNRPRNAQVVQVPDAGTNGVVSNANPWVATRGHNDTGEGGSEVNAYLNPYFQAAPGTYDYGYQSQRSMNGEMARLNRTSAVHADNTTLGPMAQSAGTQLDPSQQEQFRSQQLNLGRTLADQANGIGPSVAGSQLQQSTEMNLQAALAQAASSRGGNAGAVQYALGNARANIQQQAAMGQAQARIQEQMAARSQLGQVLSEGRGADIGMASQNAQLGQQNNQFNAGQSNQGVLTQGAMNQQTALANASADNSYQSQVNDLRSKYLAAGLSEEMALHQAKIDAERFRISSAANLYGLERGVASQQQIAQQGQTNQLIGSIFQTAGSVMGSAATGMGK